MQWLWTWGGKSFGYREGNNLWTHDGRHIGHFFENEIYNSNGNYLGEIKSENRLITNISKKSWKSSSFTPYANTAGFVNYADYVEYVMIAGYDDLPSAEDL